MANAFGNLSPGIDLTPGLNYLQAQDQRIAEQEQQNKENQFRQQGLDLQKKSVDLQEKAALAKQYDWVLSAPDANVAKQRADIVGIKDFNYIPQTGSVSFTSQDGTKVSGRADAVHQVVKMMQSGDPQIVSQASQFAVQSGLNFEQSNPASQLTGDAKNLAIMQGSAPTPNQYAQFKRDTAIPKQPSEGKLVPINSAEGVYLLNNKTGEISPASQGGRQIVPASADVELAARKEQQKKDIAAESKLKANYPKVKAAYNSQKRQWDFVDKKIDQALKQISVWTAGPGASLARIPGTPQKDLSETLNTIKANIGFDKLQNMRQNSPTGGALGQVSDLENKLLQAVLGSLEQKQSPDKLKENLSNIKEMLNTLRDETKAAFEQDYSSVIGGSTGSSVQPNKAQAPKQAIDYLKSHPELKSAFKEKYGYLPAGF